MCVLSDLDVRDSGCDVGFSFNFFVSFGGGDDDDNADQLDQQDDSDDDWWRWW